MREENYNCLPAARSIFHGASGRTGVKRLSVLELSLDNTEEKEEICFADRVLSELSFKIKNVNFKVFEFLYYFAGVFRFDVDI